MPDVFLVSRRDLRWFVENGLTAPVDTLLDERGVDFGDVYSRDALEAFSSDNRLQCMPYGVAPQVVFYNENMVDFNRMEIRGFDVPADHRRWSWDQFVTAAKFAARPFREHQGRRDRPDAGRAGAVRLLRRRGPLRRRHRPDLARVQPTRARRTPSRRSSRCSGTPR